MLGSADLIICHTISGICHSKATLHFERENNKISKVSCHFNLFILFLFYSFLFIQFVFIMFINIAVSIPYNFVFNSFVMFLLWLHRLLWFQLCVAREVFVVFLEGIVYPRVQFFSSYCMWCPMADCLSLCHSRLLFSWHFALTPHGIVSFSLFVLFVSSLYSYWSLWCPFSLFSSFCEVGLVWSDRRYYHG